MLCPKWGRKIASSTISVASDFNEDSPKPDRKIVAPTSQCRALAVAQLVRKPGVSLGLGIEGGVDRGFCPIIARLRPGSIAYRCDDLQIGDWLIAVNGINVLSLKHEEILILLRNASDIVQLSIEYDLNSPHFNKNAGSNRKSVDIYLAKEGDSFGFTLRGGAYGPDTEKCRPLTITAIRPGGPADREGRIRVSDRILSINGFDVSTSTLSAATLFLKKTKGRNVCFTVEYDVAAFNPAKNPNDSFSLDIFKLPGVDFGVSLKQVENDGRKAFIVLNVIKASLADRIGSIHVDDEIVKVNKMSLEYSTLPEVYQLLKNSARGRVRLEIIPYNSQTAVRNSIQGTYDLPNPPNHTLAAYSEPRASRNAIVEMVEADVHENEVKRHHDINNIKENGLHAKGKITFSDKPTASFVEIGAVTTTANNDYAKILKCTKSTLSNNTGNNKQQKLQHRNSHRPKPESSARWGLSQRTSICTGSLFANVSSVPCGQVCRSEVMEVGLSCWVRGGYGLILHKNVNFSESGRCPLFVSYIERGSPADKSGVLQIGDRILSINDWCASNGTADEANYIIRHASGPLNLAVEFDVIETVLPSSGVFTVKLAKRSQYLGIVIHGSTTGHKSESVIVQEVRTGSVAYRCGSIQPGDQLLSIDNIPLDTCTVDEAIRLLQKSSDIVKLRVKKNYSASYDEYEPTSIVYTVEINRKSGPLGITLSPTDGHSDPIVISHVASGGVAEKTGALHVGDTILAINGQLLCGKPVTAAMQILQQAQETVSFKISRLVSDSSSRLSQSHLSHMLFERPILSFHDHFSERDTIDKLGTPVQSIDSAVESLEDSPLLESQQPSTSSNRNSQNSNSKASSISGNAAGDAHYGDDLHVHLHKTLSTLKSAGGCGSSVVSAPIGSSQGCRSEASSSASTAPTEDEHYAQLGGEKCHCQNHSHHNQSNEDWMRVLEALETVGESEMLKKLEESILSGTVPVCGGGGGTTALGDRPRPLTPKPPPKPLNPPFALTNTILRHPFGGTRTFASQQLPADAVVGPAAAAGMSGTRLSPLTFNSPPVSSSPGGQQHSRHSILSAYEHIPFITSPVPAPAAAGSSTAAAISESALTTERSASPSSVQLSDAAATPSIDESLKEMPRMSSPAFARIAAAAAIHSSSSSSSSATAAAVRSNLTPSLPVEIHRVTLYKDLMYNDFGFSVSDGLQEKGVFINKVRAQGPADLSANIKPYDRILQVNEINVQDLDCLLAVPLLAQAGDRIELLVCRDLNVASKRPDSIEEESESERLTPEQTQV